MCNGNVEISRIKVLNLTDFYIFNESYSPEPIIFGPAYCNISKYVENCFVDKVSFTIMVKVI